MSLGSFFQNIVSKVGNWFTHALPVVETAFVSANGIVNILKTVLTSATAQTVEIVIETLAPGLSNVVFTALNTFFADYGLISNALTGSPAEIAANGLNAIGKLTGNSKVLALSNVAAIIGHEISLNSGGNSTIQQAIVANQIVHDPNVLNGNPPFVTAAPATIITEAAPVTNTGTPGNV